jgi:peptide/nickel transport system permease protein
MTRRSFARLVARRLLAAVGILLLVSFAVFSLLYIAPGSVEQILIGPREATPELIAELRAQYNLDDPFFVQYWGYLEGLLRLDFGTSIRTSEPVVDAVGAAIPVTVFLGVYAFVLTIGVGVPLGIVAALRRRSLVDRGIVGLSVAGVSAPAFATGILLLYVFSVQMGWFPTVGAGEGFVDRLWHLTLPAIALALSAGALVVKITRAAMINALDQDYLTFARARGLSQGRVLTAYALRNALVPIVSSGGLILAYVITGAVLVEVTFTLPGLGNLMIEAVTSKDFPVVQAVAMTFAAAIILINLTVDILYLVIDPRIRLEGRSG